MTHSADLQQLLTFICRRSGLVFPELRTADVLQAIERARQRLDCSSIEELHRRIRHDDVALEELVAELTIGETYFFRDRAQFDVLQNLVLPRLAARETANPIRAWSAGCATGEEAYSLSISLHRAGLSPHFHILGTDISRQRLRQARRARYGRWSLRGVSNEEIARYFRGDGRFVEVAARFRHPVEFAYLNLAEDVYPSLSTGVWGMDIIFCRNVLIYFDEAIVQRVSRQLLAALSDDGWLFLGASDPPIQDLPDCETVVTEAGLLYRRRQQAPPRVASSPPAPPRNEPLHVMRAEPAHVVSAPAVDEATWVARVRRFANQGDVQEALGNVNAALAEHRLSAELFYLRAVLEAEQGHLREALGTVRRALYLDRELIVAHMLMAHIQNRLGLATSARRSLVNAQVLLADLPSDQVVAGADGETVARLAEMVRLQLQFLGHVA